MNGSRSAQAFRRRPLVVFRPPARASLASPWRSRSLEVDPLHAVGYDVGLEALRRPVEHRFLDAIVRRQPGDIDPALRRGRGAFAPGRSPGSPSRRLRLAGSPCPPLGIGGDRERRVEARSGRVLDAVGWPRPPVGLERDVVLGCQSRVKNMGRPALSNARTSSLTAGMILSPSATARAPPGQKSLCMSTTTRARFVA